MSCKDCIYAYGGIPCNTCPEPQMRFHDKGSKVRILLPNYHRQPQGGKVGEVIGHTKGGSNLVDYAHQFHKFQGAYSNSDLKMISEEEFKRERDLEREPMSHNHEDQISTDRPDNPRHGNTLGRDSTLRQTTEMDPEVAALHSVVGRLEKLEIEACRRVLEFCVQRFLDQTLRDNGR